MEIGHILSVYWSLQPLLLGIGAQESHQLSTNHSEKILLSIYI